MNGMDWTNPLARILTLTGVTAARAAVWKTLGWIAKADAGERDFRAFAREVREDIKLVLLRVSPEIDEQSPMRLNDLGHAIATGLQAQEWAAGVAPRLLAEIEGPRTSGIATFCHEYVNTKLGDEWTERLETAGHEHGVDQDAVRTVLWTVLRDELIRAASGPGGNLAMAPRATRSGTSTPKSSSVEPARARVDPSNPSGSKPGGRRARASAVELATGDTDPEQPGAEPPPSRREESTMSEPTPHVRGEADQERRLGAAANRQR